MAIAFGTPVWVDELLRLLAVQISTRCGFPQDCVFESVAPDADHLSNPPADRFVTLFPSRFPVDVPGVSGGGRLNTGFDGTIDVKLLVRIASDQEHRSARLLRDATTGLLPLIRKVLDAVQMWNPLNTAGASLLREPARLNGFTVRPMSAKDGSTWAVVETSVSVKFSSDIPSS